LEAALDRRSSNQNRCCSSVRFDFIDEVYHGWGEKARGQNGHMGYCDEGHIAHRAPPRLRNDSDDDENEDDEDTPTQKSSECIPIMLLHENNAS
jgi:hypothetical protein